MRVDPRAALAAGDHAAVLAAFGDLADLEARCRASLGALLEDLAYVLRGAPAPLPADASLAHGSGARLSRGSLALLETVLTAYREALAREPGRLVPILHDELYWYDAPARAEHHDGALAPPPIDGQLWRWVEPARARGGWLRRLRPPAVPAVALPAWGTPGDARALSADGAHLLLAQGGLCLVDVRSGLVRMTFAGAEGGCFSPDGARLLTYAGGVASLWAVGAAAPLGVLGAHAGAIQRATFSRDGDLVFTASSRELRASRALDGSTQTSLPTQRSLDALVACGAGVLLYQGDQGWRLWDGARELTPVAEPTGGSLIFAVSWAGDRLVQYRSEVGLEGWTLPEGERLFREKTREFIMSLAFHPGGDWFAASDAILRDASTGREIGRLPAASTPWPSCDPGGRFLVTRHDDEARLWDLAGKTVVARARSGRLGPLRTHWSRDARVLAVSDRAATQVADLTRLAPAPRWRDDASPVRSDWRLCFSPSGATLVVEHERGIAFWDSARGVIRRWAHDLTELALFAAGHRVLARRGDSLIALASEDGAELWRAAVPGAFPEHVYCTDALDVLLHEERTSGEVVALGMDDGRERYRLSGVRIALHDREVFLTCPARHRAPGVTLRATASGAESLVLPQLAADRYAISPDRRWLAAARGDLELWDLATRTLQRTISTRADSFHFRADSAALIALSWQSQQSGNQDWNSECVFDVATGSCLSDKGWWDQDAEPSPPRELAPGILLHEDYLEVDGVRVALPHRAVVCHSARGELLVASAHGGRVELRVLERAPG